MLEGDSLIGPINEPAPPRDLETEAVPEPAPVIAPPPTHDGGENHFANLAKAWKRSVCLKVFTLIMLLVLAGMVIFIVFTIRNSRKANKCESDLSKTQGLLKHCNARVTSLSGEISRLQQDLRSKNEEHDRLKTQHTDLEKKHTELQKTFNDNEASIRTLNGDIHNLQDKIDGLKKDKESIQSEIHKLEEDISKVKTQITQKQNEIKEIDDSETMYKGVTIVLSGTGLFTMYQAYQVKTEVDDERDKAERWKEENIELDKSLKNLTVVLAELEKEKNVLTKEVGELQEKSRKCQGQLSILFIKLRACGQRRTELYNELAATRRLAVDLAKVQYLKQFANYTVSVTRVYNSTTDRRTDKDFRKAMARRKYPVVVLNTTSGKLFGMGLSIPWPGEDELRNHNDKDCFTFSVHRGVVCKVVDDNGVFGLREGYMFHLGPPEISVQMQQEQIIGTAKVTSTFDCGSHADPVNFYGIGDFVHYTDILGYSLEINKIVKTDPV